MQIARHKAVTIEYTLTDEHGEVLDTSKDGEPLSYIQGIGTLIPGLESALEGKSRGESLKVAVAPEQGYGLRDEALIQVVSREMFQAGEIEVGMRFRAHLEGDSHTFIVVAIQGDEVTIDGNHPLAGKPLNFDVTIKEVRDATEEELSHGHVHGPHGH